MKPTFTEIRFALKNKVGDFPQENKHPRTFKILEIYVDINF